MPASATKNRTRLRTVHAVHRFAKFKRTGASCHCRAEHLKLIIACMSNRVLKAFTFSTKNPPVSERGQKGSIFLPIPTS